MNLKKYFCLTRAGIMESLRFRISTLTIVIGNTIYMFIAYFLWKAIYESVDTDVVNGMTFYDTLIYLVLAKALFSFMEMYIVWEMGDNIRTGKIALNLVKPIDCKSYTFWSQSGNFIMSFFTTFLPTFIIIYFLTHGTLHIGFNMVFFAVSVVMSIVINFSIDYIVGTICLYTQSIWGINIMKEVIVLLLSGATIPIAFFPGMLKKIVYFLPFQSIYNTPLTILIDKNMNVKDVLLLLLFQLFWTFVMVTASNLFWKKSLKIITVNGG